MEKKANKLAFKQEKTRQEKELLNLKQNMQGLKLSWWNWETYCGNFPNFSFVLRRELLTHTFASPAQTELFKSHCNKIQ